MRTLAAILLLAASASAQLPPAGSTGSPAPFGSSADASGNVTTTGTVTVGPATGVNGSVCLNGQTSGQACFAALAVQGSGTLNMNVDLGAAQAYILDTMVTHNSGVFGYIAATTFTGTGTNDALIGGAYVGTVNAGFCAVIDATGTPDTFKWGTDNCVTFGTTGVAITGSNQLLSNGVYVVFNTTTGHTLADQWTASALYSCCSLAQLAPVIRDANGNVVLQTSAATANSTARLTVVAGTGATGPALQVVSSSTNTPGTIIAKGQAAIYLQSNGGLALGAVNAPGNTNTGDFPLCHGAATANPATVDCTATSQGSDANINFNVVAKGTGQVEAGGVPVAVTPAAQVNASDQLSAGTIGTTETAFATTNYTIPANYLVAGKMVRVTWSFVESSTSSTGLKSGTYTSGGSITGTSTQTCTLSSFNGSLSSATATVALTGTNTIAGGTALVVTAAGSGGGTVTSATLGNGTATCSGTATITTVLGTPTAEFKIRLGGIGGVTVFDSTAITPSSATASRTMAFSCIFAGTAAAGASVAVLTSCMGPGTDSPATTPFGIANTVVINQNIATNASQLITPTMQFGTAVPGNTVNEWIQLVELPVQ